MGKGMGRYGKGIGGGKGEKGTEGREEDRRYGRDGRGHGMGRGGKGKQEGRKGRRGTTAPKLQFLAPPLNITVTYGTCIYYLLRTKA